jgi:hypothetical protein
MADLQRRQNDLAGAVQLYRESLDIKRKTFPEGHWEIATLKSLIGACFTTMGQYGEAEPLLTEAYPVIKAAFGDAHNRTRVALERVVDLYDGWGKTEAANKYRALLPERPPVSR